MIGQLRKHIYFYEINQGQPDGIGGYITDESQKHAEWCNVKELKGKRAFEFMQIHNTKPYIFIIRTDSYDVTYNTILEYEENAYTIHSITTDELKRFTEIIAWI